MSKPYIIMSAPNGAKRQKADHPAIPITPTEIAKCAEEILEAGASILHLHVRDSHNLHTLDVDRYRASIGAVRNAVGDQLIIQVTTEAVGQYLPAQQMQMVRELKPEAVSLALRELCPTEKQIPEAAKFFSWLQKEKIFPQYILYDQQDLTRFDNLRAQGVFHEEFPFILLVIGRDQSLQSTSLLDVRPETPWAKCGFGQSEKNIIQDTAKFGGHVRVGFENNIYWDEGRLLNGHKQMIEYCQHQAKQAGRKVATADTVREMFSLS